MALSPLAKIKEMLRRKKANNDNILDCGVGGGRDKGKMKEGGCGSSHRWDPYMMPVIRELPMLKLVIDNPSCGYVTFVKIKGFFKYRFESIVSCLNGIEKPKKKIKKNTITKKTKKTKKVLKKKKVK